MNFNKKTTCLFIIVFVFCMFCKPVFCALLIGALTVWNVIYFSIFLNDINKNGKETIGKILSYEIEDEGYKSPLVEFEVNGKKILQKPYYYASTDLSKIKAYKNNISKSIPIIYIPNNPGKFIIKSERGFNYFSLILFGIAGLVFILISLAQIFNFISIDSLK